jgi:hypothetical protein
MYSSHRVSNLRPFSLQHNALPIPLSRTPLDNVGSSKSQPSTACYRVSFIYLFFLRITIATVFTTVAIDRSRTQVTEYVLSWLFCTLLYDKHVRHIRRQLTKINIMLILHQKGLRRAWREILRPRNKSNNSILSSYTETLNLIQNVDSSKAEMSCCSVQWSFTAFSK